MSDNLTYSNFENRYRNRQYIGAGGFGKVFKVFDHAKNHYVALKVSDVRPEWNKFTLKNEVELVNKLPYHRNIARYDACYRFNTGITGDMDFAILKFYEHGNLEQFLKRETLRQEDKKLIIQGILDGLNFLHTNNIIHRDLKSQNILLSREDGVWTPKITDFGLSREVDESSTITNSAVGMSFAYAAPEQILHQKINFNVDLWAVGVIIYRIIADELPFKSNKGKSEKSAQSQLELSNKIVNLELPEKLKTLESPYKELIELCLVKEPENRVKSPSELIEVLNGTEALSPYSQSTKERNDQSENYNDETVIIQRKESSNNESLPDRREDSNRTEMDYEIPNQNVTQFIQPQKKTVEEVKEVRHYSPENTGDKKPFNLKTVLIPLAALLVIGAVLWLFAFDGLKTISQNQTSNEVKSLSIAKETQGEMYNMDNLEVLEMENDESKEDPERLAVLKNELIDLSKEPEYQRNYRVHFILAKNKAYRDEGMRDVLESLQKSVHIAMGSANAIKNKSAKALISDMKANEDDALAQLKNYQNGNIWNDIIQALNQSE